MPYLTTSLERVLLLNSDHFGKVGAEPLGVKKVEVAEETAVVKVQQYTILVQEVGGLVQLVVLLVVASLMHSSPAQ